MTNLTKQVREYLDHAATGASAAARCDACSTVFLPPRALCPQCGSDDLGWEQIDGAEATVYTLTRLADGRGIALADVDGVAIGRLYAQVVGADAHSVHIGHRVRVGSAVLVEDQPAVPVLMAGEQE